MVYGRALRIIKASERKPPVQRSWDSRLWVFGGMHQLDTGFARSWPEVIGPDPDNNRRGGRGSGAGVSLMIFVVVADPRCTVVKIKFLKQQL